MTNILRAEWKVPSGGVLSVTLVTPEPVTVEQTQEFGKVVDAVEWSKLAGAKAPASGDPRKETGEKGGDDG